MGLCLPRSRIATIEASRPTTKPSASIMTHFLSTSAGLAEKVFIFASIMEARRQGPAGALGAIYPAARRAVNTGEQVFLQYFNDMGIRYYATVEDGIEYVEVA